MSNRGQEVAVITGLTVQGDISGRATAERVIAARVLHLETALSATSGRSAGRRLL